MAILKIPDVVPQSTPVNEDRGDPALPGLLSRSYWLFLNGIQTVLGLMASAVDTLQTANYVYGGSALTTVNKIPKVTAAGILGNSSLSDGTNGVTQTRTIAGAAQPQEIFDSGITAKSRIGRVVNTANLVSQVNISYDGTNWNLDDVTQIGVILSIVTTGVEIYFAPAAANPAVITLVATFDGAGNINALLSHKVAGTKVVGVRGAALTATAPAGNAAGVGYLQADAATWVTLMNRNKTRIDELEARLSAAAGHGLIA